MSRIVKILLILLVLILFSSGIVSFVSMFISTHPKMDAILGLASIMLCITINQDIIDKEEIEKEINEFDETF